MLATLAVGWLLAHVHLVMGDVGTATSYNPPYLRMYYTPFLFQVSCLHGIDGRILC